MFVSKKKMGVRETDLVYFEIFSKAQDRKVPLGHFTMSPTIFILLLHLGLGFFLIILFILVTTQPKHFF